MHLAAPHAIAELDVDRRQPAAGLRRDFDGRFADQIADDAQIRGDVAARDLRDFDRHRRTESAAAARTAKAPATEAPARTAAAHCRHPRHGATTAALRFRACAWSAAAAGCSRLMNHEIERGASDGDQQDPMIKNLRINRRVSVPDVVAREWKRLAAAY